MRISDWSSDVCSSDLGQATAYKVGMIRIQELRRKAEAELGDGFDIRGFNDAVLGGGALPLALLERRVDRWIAEQKNTAAGRSDRCDRPGTRPAFSLLPWPLTLRRQGEAGGGCPRIAAGPQ